MLETRLFFNQRLSKYEVMRYDRQSELSKIPVCGNRLGKEGRFWWCPRYGRVAWAWHQRSHRQRSSSLHKKSVGNWVSLDQSLTKILANDMQMKPEKMYGGLLKKYYSYAHLVTRGRDPLSPSGQPRRPLNCTELESTDPNDHHVHQEKSSHRGQWLQVFIFHTSTDLGLSQSLRPTSALSVSGTLADPGTTVWFSLAFLHTHG